MEGGALQLGARGDQDKYLTGNPQMTYFKGVFKRHTNFAMEQIREEFDGTFDFGKTVYCDISRKGDLINTAYLQVFLPAIPQPQGTTEISSASWINAIGHVMISRVDIEIGGVRIDRHYGEWLEIWSELTIENERRDVFNDMVGRSDNYNPTMKGGEQELFVPLNFWFCRSIGLSLPIVAIQHHNVRFIFDIRQFDECYTIARRNLLNASCDDPEPECGLPLAVGETLKVKDAFLWVDNIFLDEKERRVFVNETHHYLVETLQVQVQGLDKNTIDHRVDLNFNFPTKAIYWVIRKDGSCLPYGNDREFDFSDRISVPREDPMLSAKLQVEGNDLFRRRINKFFREYVPFRRHTRVPQRFIYMYSFADSPEDWKPTGTLNLSMIDNFTLNMRIKSDLESSKLDVYALSYNILVIDSGMAGLMYKN